LFAPERSHWHVGSWCIPEAAPILTDFRSSTDGYMDWPPSRRAAV